MDREKIKKKLLFWYSILWVLLLTALWEGYIIFFPNTTTTKSKWLGLFAGAIFILLSVCKNCELSYFYYKNPLIEDITKYFKEGLKYFYNNAVKYIIFAVILIGYLLKGHTAPEFMPCYTTGAIIGLITLWGVNIICTNSNSKIAYAVNILSKNINRLLFSFGVAVCGFCLGLCLSSIVILFHIFKDYQSLSGYCLGFALVAFINTTLSTIAKKGTSEADNIFLNTEDQLEKNDKRNPLLLLLKGIAKANFTINSTVLELTNAFVTILVASMITGGYCYYLMGSFFPIIVASSGIFSSVLIILLTKQNDGNNPAKSMFFYSLLNVIITNSIGYYIVKCWFKEEMGLFYSIVIGTIGGLILTFINFKQTQEKYKVAKAISNTASNGIYSFLFRLISECSKSAFLPCIIFSGIIILSFLMGYGTEAPTFGVFSITLSILSFISTVGLNLSYGIFAYGTIGANAINANYEKDLNAAQNVDIISQNTHNLVIHAKNFINSVTFLGAIGILTGCTIAAGIDEVDMLNPYVTGALILGACIPYLYCSIVVKAANKVASRLIYEAKKHFRMFPAILNYQVRPDYESFAKISANSSSMQTTIILFVFLTVIYIINKFLTIEALVGFMASVILSSIGLVYTLNNGENIISNVKKYFVSQYQNAQYTNEYGLISQTDKMLKILGDLLIPSINSLLIFLCALILAIAPIHLK